MLLHNKCGSHCIVILPYSLYPILADATKTLHYIELGTSPTIETQTVSRYESEPIFVEFPFGASNQSKVHVS